MEDEIIHISARHMPSPMASMMQIIVLKACHGDLYTCYTGVVLDTSIDDPEYQQKAALWVMKNGYRLPFEEARIHFTTELDRDKYYT